MAICYTNYYFNYKVICKCNVFFFKSSLPNTAFNIHFSANITFLTHCGF